MKLCRLYVEGYRSIREPLVLHVDGRVTVILGANDHGKSNLLKALRHLNEDAAFDTETDLNWDLNEKPKKFPLLKYTLELTDEERSQLLRMEGDRRRLAAYDEWCDALERRWSDLDAQARTAQTELDQAVAAAKESSADSSPEPVVEGVDAATRGPEEEAAAKRALRNDLDGQRSGAAHRLAFARGERERILSEVRGERSFDLQQQLDRAEEESIRLETVAQEQLSKAADASSQLEAAQSQHAEGTAERKEAEKHAKTTADASKSADHSASAAKGRLEQLRASAEAAQLVSEGTVTLGDDEAPPSIEPQALDAMPREIEFVREGVEGALEVAEAGVLDPENVRDTLVAMLPRVELIEPQDSLPDMATRESIATEKLEFMRGIFHYAGVDPEEWDGVFQQNDRTTKRLDDASNQLNETLRKAWSQGMNLEFGLRHRGAEIDLMIKDPSVEGTYVRPSHRSSGFTHFFAVKTMLHAREQASSARSYIWLFDEPGIYLHPAGQHDLLQVLETLALQNQIVYTTHSIFLVNKNYPTRHRLLDKNTHGTVVDRKPFAGRWRAAIEALGLALPGTILFASHVLLVEGDSDPIYLYADFQQLTDRGALEADINSLSIIATGDSKHADALVRMLLEGSVKPKITLLFDGDKGGLDRHKSLKRLVDSQKLPVHVLPSGTTIEDHLVAPDLFKEAAIKYVEELSDKDKRDAVRARLNAALDAAETPSKGIANIVRDVAKDLLEQDDPPSSVGIARHYASLLLDVGEDQVPTINERSLELVKTLIGKLELGAQTLPQSQIVETLPK